MRATCTQCGGGINTAKLPAGETRCSGCRKDWPGLSRKPMLCVRCGRQIMATREGAACRACRQRGLRDCPMCGGATHGHGPCKACRGAARNKTCAECGAPFVARLAGARFCSAACSNRWHGKARQIRHPYDQSVKRSQRQTSAPGLGYRAQRALVAKWVKQGRMCIYWPHEGCTGKATELEHVLPLVRGGTNYEGNLAPVCKHCNSSKSGLTVIEWLHNRRLPPVDTCPTMAPSITKTKRANQLGTPVQLEMRLCVACGAMHVRDSDYCSGRCHSRSLYRLRVGKPITDPLDNRGRRAVA